MEYRKSEKPKYLAKDEFCQRLAKRSGLSLETCHIVYEAYPEAIIEAVAEGRNVRIRRFGSFFPKRKARYQVRNPKTGDPMIVEEHYAPVFRFSDIFRDFIRRKRE